MLQIEVAGIVITITGGGGGGGSTAIYGLCRYMPL